MPSEHIIKSGRHVMLPEGEGGGGAPVLVSIIIVATIKKSTRDLLSSMISSE